MEGMIFGPEAWVSVGEVGLGLRLVAIAAVLLVMALVAGFVLAVVFRSTECSQEEPFDATGSDVDPLCPIEAPRHPDSDECTYASIGRSIGR